MTATTPDGATRHPPEPRHDPERHRPHLPGRARAMAVTGIVLPPLAWLTSLALSYLVQDFTCSAYESAARPGPDGTVLTWLLVVNGVLLLLTLLASWGGWVRYRDGEGADRFLGAVGVGAGLLFALGIVWIAVPPLFLEVCP